MRKPLRLLRLGLALSTLASVAWAPVRQQADRTVRVTQVDRSHFPEVTVYVSVTDASGEPVPFSPDELNLEENGVVVEPSAVEGTGHVGSLSTLLVMDVSGSMEVAGKLDAAQAAARAYVDQMRPEDQAGLLAFNVEVDYVQPLTSDRPALRAAIDGLTARHDTAMYDALVRATDILASVGGRKAVLVLTDGMDNSSRATLEDVLSGIGPAGLSISTIGLGNVQKVGVSFEGLDAPALKDLAQRAGGAYGFADDPSMLTDIYQRFGRALQSEYAVTYRSPGNLRDGVNRTIRVTLAGAGVGTNAYNPGGVIPEVPQQAGGTIFLGALAVLLGLLVLPGAVGWIRACAPGWVPKRRPASRIRLREPEANPTASRTQTQTQKRRRDTAAVVTPSPPAPLPQGGRGAGAPGFGISGGTRARSADYSIQLDSTVSPRSGWSGSLVMTCTRKLCRPPMSPCIMNCIETRVLSPGWRTIEPMVGMGGQHPSTTSMYGASASCSGWSPTLVSTKEASTVRPSWMSPRSISSLSTFRRGCPVTSILGRGRKNEPPSTAHRARSTSASPPAATRIGTRVGVTPAGSETLRSSAHLHSSN